MKTLMPVLSAICVVTVGAIAGNHFVLQKDAPMREVTVYVPQSNVDDVILAEALREVEMGAPLDRATRAIARPELTPEQVEFGARRWQSFKDEAARAKASGAFTSLAQGRRAAPQNTKVKKRKPRSEGPARTGYSGSAADADGDRNIYQRSKKFKQQDRMYREDQRRGSKYRGTTKYRSDFSRALRSPDRKRSVFERSKRYAKSGSIYSRRHHRNKSRGSR